MNDEQLLRYSRHILLDEIGIEGQQRIQNAKVLVVGAGGLASSALMYLAAAGCGHLTFIDHDQVDLTNLQRQIVHTTDRVGQAKVASASQTLAAINPDVQLHALEAYADEATLKQLVESSDVVLDCTDNFKTRQLVNRMCVESKKPLVSGSAIRWDGQVSVFDTRHNDAPCYACLYPPHQVPEEVACSVMGVFAPLTGIIGSTQAAEALKIISQSGKLLVGRLLLLNALEMSWTELKIRKNPHCPVCRAL